MWLQIFKCARYGEHSESDREKQMFFTLRLHSGHGVRLLQSYSLDVANVHQRIYLFAERIFLLFKLYTQQNQPTWFIVYI